MLAAVIGGGLQGVEAAYLARKAGWEVIVIDRNTPVPAARLGQVFMQEDVTRGDDLFHMLPNVDIVIPALENAAVLPALERRCREAGIPFAFDIDAYAVSSSKITSGRLFARLGIPVPRPYPEASFPLVAKPAGGSGSRGVKIIHDPAQLAAAFPDPAAMNGWVIQEYVPGPSYSLEIVGFPGNYEAIQVTDLAMDAVYDCKRVTAPTDLNPGQADRFVDISLQIARALSLKGIMDVEVILHRDELKVLEIDARLPSQTPIAVYRSTGINMLELLAANFMDPGHEAKANKKRAGECRGVVLEHIKVANSRLEVCGERIMKSGGFLHIRPGFFGADEAITDYEAGKEQWVATLITAAADKEKALLKRNKVIETLCEKFKLKQTG